MNDVIENREEDIEDTNFPATEKTYKNILPKEDLNKLTQFFSLLIEIDQKQKRKILKNE